MPKGKRQAVQLPKPEHSAEAVAITPPMNSVVSATVLSSMENLVSKGLSYRQAAIGSGISESTWEDWKTKGEAGLVPYNTIVGRLKLLHSRWQSQRAQRIEAAGDAPEHWKANAWLLEHNKDSRSDWAHQDEQGKHINISIGVQQGTFTRLDQS